MKKLIAAIKKMVRFLNKDIWNIHDSANKPYRRLYYRTLKIVLIAARGFVKDNCSLRASALTFYSMLSIVPVLAMAFGIAQGFGFRKSWSQWLRQNFSGQEDVLDEIIAFVDNLLANVNGGVVAGAGLIFLFWTVLQLMNNIEESLNTVWETDRPRTWERKFTDYLTVVLIAPVLVFISSGITVFVTGQIESALSLLSSMQFLLPLLVAITAAELLGVELANGTMPTILLRPVTRPQWLAAKLVVVAAYPFMIMAVFLLASLLAGSPYGFGSFVGGTGLGDAGLLGAGVMQPGEAFGELLQGYAVAALALVPVGLLSVLFTVVFMSAAGGALATLSVLIFMQLLVVFPRLEQYLLTTQLNAYQYAVNGVPWAVALMVVYSALFAAVAVVLFERKDF